MKILMAEDNLNKLDRWEKTIDGKLKRNKKPHEINTFAN